MASRAPARARVRATPSPISMAAQAPFREAVDRVEIRLPMPPSVNRLWRPVARGKQVLSPEYRAWRADAGLEILKQRPCRVAGRYRLAIALGKLSSRADPDNFIKAPSDLLVEHGIVADDSLARDVLAYRDTLATERGIVVIVEAVEARP